MKNRHFSNTRNGAPKIDALSSLQGLGYTALQAKNIRMWLPRQFGMGGLALPRANYEFWKAYEIVKDMQQYRKTNALSLQFSGYAKGRTVFQFTDNEFLEYRSPTLHSTVWSLEFVRHFGNGLWRSSTDAFEGGPRQLEYIGDNLRLKRGELATRIVEMEATQTVYDLNADGGYLPRNLERYTENARESIATLFTMAAVCHSNLTLKSGWNLNPERLCFTKYQHCDSHRLAFAIGKLCELYPQKEQSIRSHVIRIMQTPNHIQLINDDFIPGVYHEGGNVLAVEQPSFVLSPAGSFIPSALQGSLPAFFVNLPFAYGPSTTINKPMLFVPKELRDAHTEEDWILGARLFFKL